MHVQFFYFLIKLNQIGFDLKILNSHHLAINNKLDRKKKKPCKTKSNFMPASLIYSSFLINISAISNIDLNLSSSFYK